MGLSRNEKVMVIVLLAGTLLVVLNQTFLSPALPTIMADLAVDATTVQWLTSGYALVEAVIIPLNAFLVGRFSTRRLFMGGLSMFALGSLVAAAAPVFPVLLLGRVMQACGTGVVMPMVFTLIILLFPRERRGSAMGIVGLVISFAPAVGPSISGILIDSVGWRALFVIVVVLAIAVVTVAGFFLENRKGFERASFDAPSVILLACGMVGLLYGLSTFASGNPVVSALLMIVGLALLGVFARRQLALESPMLRVGVLKTREYRIGVIAVALLQAAVFGGCSVVVPLYIQGVLGESATVSGLVMLPGAAIGAGMSVVAGRLFDNYGARAIALSGGAVAALAACGLAACGIDTSIIIVAVPYTLMVIGVQCVMMPINTWGINALPNDMVPHGNAISSTINQVGISFGTAFIVSLTALGATVMPASDAAMQTFAGDRMAFIGVSALMVAVFLIILLLVKDAKGEAPSAAFSDEAPVADLRSKPVLEWVVSDVMDRACANVPEDGTVGDALAIFAQSGTSGLPVTDGAGAVVGFISDGDVMKYLGSEDFTFSDGSTVFRVGEDRTFQDRLDAMRSLNVMEIATKRVIAVDAGMALEDACKILAERRIKKLPVISAGRFVGSISRRNVVRALAAVDAGRLPEWVS